MQSAHTFSPICFICMCYTQLYTKTDTHMLSQAYTRFQEAAGEHLHAHTHTHKAVVVTFIINGLMEFPLLVKKD